MDEGKDEVEGLASLQERYLQREAEIDFEAGKKLKVCPKCGWQGRTQLLFCWNFRRLGQYTPCKDENGDHQRLEVAE